jgi:hypothetical protein
MTDWANPLATQLRRQRTARKQSHLGSESGSGQRASTRQAAQQASSANVEFPDGEESP